MGELRPEEFLAATRPLMSEQEDELTLLKLDSRNYLAASASLAPPAEGGKNSMKRSSVSVTELDTVERDTWEKKMDFLLSVIGFAVDLGNVWRFPYLVFKNGGGAFFIPYLMMYLLGGIPLFYMELALGQFNRKGAVTTWGRICPLFKGIGYCVVMIAFYTDFFYNVIISWALYFFFASFAESVPWSNCNNTWNTESCYEPSTLTEFTSTNSNSTHLVCRAPLNYSSGINVTKPRSSSDEYFHNSVLTMRHFQGIEHPGNVKWQLALCLFAVYLICYFSLWKGIKMSGKVVWFTATFPYIVLVCLLVRGLTLPGASEGIKYYLYPDITKLAEGQVWFDAATQVFFSLGPGFGVLMAFSSYNKFHNNVYYDALLTGGINALTSFLAGFVIFSVLGYMSCKSGKPIADVAAEGPGLVFVVYPEALQSMPGSTIWSILFFLMLLTLGLDSSFGGSEAIITGLSDEFHWIKKHREIFTALLFSLYMVVGLLMCTEGGLFFVDFMNTYAATYGMLIAVLCETMVISWIYGLDRFSSDIEEMLGFRPGWYWRFCWSWFGPAFLLFNLIFGLLTNQPMDISTYVDPSTEAASKDFSLQNAIMNSLGFIMAFSSAVCIPIFAVYALVQAKGNTLSEKFKNCLIPWRESAAVDYLRHQEQQQQQLLRTNKNEETTAPRPQQLFLQSKKSELPADSVDTQVRLNGVKNEGTTFL